ncbi:hypothetical protein BGZ80_005976 [Entomortierella chlamydospora]|uniref:Ricin B lectin domain-containing protein n=1 Tax=Entomortierella chlamydospora TaxID=101097 RepID=A0A9P6SU08_9FUNG|nr:hypothetical protein BGZ80_005976 [Entomortierella chlamydospora]
MTHPQLPQTAIRLRNLRHGTMLYDNVQSGLIPWQESTNPDGYWYITHVTENTYKIKNRQSGNCVYYNVDKKKPITWRDSANGDGVWEFVPTSIVGQYRIRNVLTPTMYLYHNHDHGIIGHMDNGEDDGIWAIKE